ncbi:hypothetical protein JJD41_07740 [Oxynema sp. CENA135]|uniref:glycosyl hydrolase family 28-related protein n=1 Tax=Oxynema sp. CENA135 TaxID=984206 RepID=UPI00190A805C|nr:glycosyl hydrolase family 28-related protein [Oxynema sp. CENA135]MBK4729761.1 hypothetical protein [Oxynema sp. CENA135]
MNARFKAWLRQWRKPLQVLSLFGFFLSTIAAVYIFTTLAIQPASDRPSPVKSPSTAVVPVSNCATPSGGPTDNPIAGAYGERAYPWTAQIPWNCVYNVQDFEGNSAIARFNAARDAAARRGGGVVYFPPGIYEFSDNLELKDGVVLRGATPGTTDAGSDRYAPPSKLVFPEYKPQLSGNGTPNETAFKTITTENGDRDSNLGLVHLDINRAAILLGTDVSRAQNKNIVIFGVRSNNVARPDPNVPDLSFQAPWMRYSDRFATNIKINAFENVLIANNRLNDAITDTYEQPGYRLKSAKGDEIITYSEGDRVPFDYANHYGIAVNRSKPGGFQLNADPNSEPGLFREGIEIRDNWVYHTMRVAIHASGKELKISNNIIRDRPNKQWWTHPTGLKQPTGAVTLENRAIDWSGWEVTVEGNDYQVYRHRIMDSDYLSVDGEGILIQECCGGSQVNGAKIANNRGNSYIGFYKVPDIKNVVVSGNELLSNVTNTALIYVNADTNNAPHQMHDVRVENNRINGNIFVQASAGGSNNTIANNRGGDRAEIEASCHVEIRDNSGFTVKPCRD